MQLGGREAGNSSEVSDDDNVEFISLKPLHDDITLHTATTQ